jgi:hypothetical protein
MDKMKTSETWDMIEGKMLELRILTNANWKNSEWELAALGERVLRTVEMAKAESEKLREDADHLEKSVDNLKKEWEYRQIFQVQPEDEKAATW